jgi:hypothetical protein
MTCQLGTRLFFILDFLENTGKSVLRQSMGMVDKSRARLEKNSMNKSKKKIPKTKKVRNPGVIPARQRKAGLIQETVKDDVAKVVEKEMKQDWPKNDRGEDDLFLYQQMLKKRG